GRDLRLAAVAEDAVAVAEAGVARGDAARPGDAQRRRVGEAARLAAAAAVGEVAVEVHLAAVHRAAVAVGEAHQARPDAARVVGGEARDAGAAGGVADLALRVAEPRAVGVGDALDADAAVELAHAGVAAAALRRAAGEARAHAAEHAERAVAVAAAGDAPPA